MIIVQAPSFSSSDYGGAKSIIITCSFQKIANFRTNNLLPLCQVLWHENQVQFSFAQLYSQNVITDASANV
jgi:hypothetical protein